MTSWPQIRARRWQAVKLNCLARRAFALTMWGHRRGLFGRLATYVGLSMASMLNHAAMRLLRRRRSEDRTTHFLVFDPQSRYVLNRFLAKLAVLSIGAAAQARAPWGLRIAIVSIALVSAMTSSGLAMFWHERPAADSLNYWDEAVWFLGIGIATLWVA